MSTLKLNYVTFKDLILVFLKKKTFFLKVFENILLSVIFFLKLFLCQVLIKLSLLKT